MKLPSPPTLFSVIGHGYVIIPAIESRQIIRLRVQLSKDGTVELSNAGQTGVFFQFSLCGKLPMVFSSVGFLNTNYNLERIIGFTPYDAQIRSYFFDEAMQNG